MEGVSQQGNPKVPVISTLLQERALPSGHSIICCVPHAFSFLVSHHSMLSVPLMALTLHLLTHPASSSIYWCCLNLLQNLQSLSETKELYKKKGLCCKNEKQHVEKSESSVGVHLSEGAGLCAALREEALGKERVGDAQKIQWWFLTF